MEIPGADEFELLTKQLKVSASKQSTFTIERYAHSVDSSAVIVLPGGRLLFSPHSVQEAIGECPFCR
jgi:hypothetical protein